MPKQTSHFRVVGNFFCVWILTCAFAFRASGQQPGVSQRFYQAIRTNDLAQLRSLIAVNGANVKDAEGTPILMTATLHAGADCLELLLNLGANPNLPDANGATALMWAIPDMQKVKLLVARGADVNARSTNLQRTPLLIAASYPGSAEVLRFLVSKGSDLHAKDKNGASALTLAAYYSDLDAVRFLVENGSDLNALGNVSTGGSFWFNRHYSQSTEYLLSKGANIPPTALRFAAGWLPSNVVEKWIEIGADVNAQENTFNKRTPLISAVSSEATAPGTLRLLLQKGADPNAQDIDGERALDWAIYRDDKEKIQALQQFGAKRGSGPRQQTFPPPEGVADARTSLARSIALLLPSAPVIFQKRACITCHNQSMPQQVAVAARAKGIPVNEELASRNLQQIVTVYKSAGDAAMQGVEPAGRALTIGYIMMALADERHPLDKVTAPFTHLVAASQMSDGSWIDEGISRPPIESSEISITAMAVRALTLYPIAGRKSELSDKVRRARSWLLAAKPQSAEERAMRLMGLAWSNAPKAEIQAAIGDVVAQQRMDGGWSQLLQLNSDAYATGISLYALHQAGIPATHDVYKKGVTFLLKNQYQDGSWFVKTRSFPVQPHLDSGYPFGFNQWISAAGASWASLAIAYTLPDAASAH